MYSDAFCKVYNEFGWNYFPRAFGEQLVEWIKVNGVKVEKSLDLACGTGILCEVLWDAGIKSSGMDFSEGMIEIARNSRPEIEYDVADMITYRPEKKFDLVTCTGDALNHIIDLENVRRIFENVHYYLEKGGYFIFDILNEREVHPGEPIDLDFSETVKAQFTISRNEAGIINLNTTVYENGVKQFEENINETVHDVDAVLRMLKETGFEVLKCSDQILDGALEHSTTWYIIARKN